MARLLAVVFATCVTLLACKGGSPPPAPPEPTPTEPADPVEPAEPVIDTAALGQPCGEGDSCQPAASCVAYYGIAGPSGPQFKSCEITCGGKGTCPEGTACVTVADGPGEVCRAN